MISILIPTTTGGFTHLTKLMPGLAVEATQNKAEIIVIDNASKDGTVNYLSNYECTIVVNKVNKGFAKAHNHAAKIAQGDYLLLLNNDTMISLGLLETLKKTFELNPKIGAVGCLVVKMDDQKRVQHAGVMFTPDYIPYELGLGIPDTIPVLPFNDERVHSVREVPSVTAACVMIKKNVFDEVGGFNEEYRNGWEDTDLILKIREKGYKVWYNGTTQVLHKHFGSINVGRFKFENENRALYEDIWVKTDRAKRVLGNFING